LEIDLLERYVDETDFWVYYQGLKYIQFAVYAAEIENS